MSPVKNFAVSLSRFRSYIIVLLPVTVAVWTELVSNVATSLSLGTCYEIYPNDASDTASL